MYPSKLKTPMKDMECIISVIFQSDEYGTVLFGPNIPGHATSNNKQPQEEDMSEPPKSPKADASTEYIGFYYQNVVQNQETLRKLQKMGVKSLELETTGGEEGKEERLPKSMRKTLKQVMDGTLCVITKGGGASPAAIELWERFVFFFFFFFFFFSFFPYPFRLSLRWKDLLGDLFFSFEHSFEDGDGPDSYWRYTSSHRYNSRLPIDDRKNFSQRCCVHERGRKGGLGSGEVKKVEIRRVEVLRPLDPRPEENVRDGEGSGIGFGGGLTVSQFAFKARKHFEYVLLGWMQRRRGRGGRKGRRKMGERKRERSIF